MAHVTAIAVLAGPLVANNLALSGMSLSDTIMAGRLSRLDLAGVAVGNGLWMLFFLFGLGVLMAMSPSAAHAVGDKRYRQVGVYCRQTLWLSQALAVVLFFGLRTAANLLEPMGIEPSVAPVTRGYLYAISWGMPGIFAYLSLRFTSEGIGHTRPIMFIALIGLAVNIAGNYVLMYGKLGFPALGAVGCGYASAINMYAMLAAMTFYVRSTPGVYGRYALFEGFTWPQWAVCRELLWLGFPIGIGIVAEVALFSGSSLLMGTLGVDAAAAHQISINYAATMFMVPMGISSAMVIHIGQALGRNERAAARTAGIVGTVMCGAFMAVSALAMLVFSEQIIALYTSEPSVRVIAISLIALAAIFQVADGVQVGAIGALRGYKDTKIPMLLNFVSFWAIGLVWAWQSGIVRGNGPTGIWMGMVVALFAAAVLNVARFQWVSRRRLAPEAQLQL